MKTLYHIKLWKITQWESVVFSDFHVDDDVYFDKNDCEVHVSLIDQSHVWQLVKVYLTWTETVYIWLDSWDEVVEWLDINMFKRFVLTDLDRIELSYKKNIKQIDWSSVLYEQTDISNRLISIDSWRYNELISAL